MMKNRTNDLTPYRKKQFRTYFQFSLIALCFVVVFVIFYACSGKASSNKLNAKDVKLIQYQVPKDSAPVVVFETNKGTFKAVIYKDEVPEYTKYFIGLVNKGYYNGTHVFAVEKNVYFMGGSKAKDGTDTSDTDKTDYDQELTPKLWPFKGSLIAYGNKGGSFFSSKIQAGSRVLFVNSVEFTKSFNKQLDSAGGNEDLVNAFKQKGGVPNFSQQYTVFGQVYDGMDTYEKICGTDVENSSNLIPTTDITFTKVYMSTYGENKKDEFFSLDSSKASSDSQSDSSQASSADSTESSNSSNSSNS